MFKDILLGVGITLIIIASILMVTDFMITNRTKSVKNKELSRQEIIAEARKIGMGFAGEEYYKNNQQDFSLQQSTVLTLPQSNSTQETISAPVVIKIPSGISSRKVADLLLEKKLIKDKKSFIKLLTKFDLENKIMAGRYEFEADISPLKLILFLTTK